MVPFVGGSYSLTFRKADVQRSVGWFPSVVESGTGKSPAILQEVPGLTSFADCAAPIRGSKEVAGRAFFVAGSILYELDSAGVATTRGALNSATSRVDMAYGLTQLVIVDGANGYVFDLASNVLTPITAAGFYGSARVAFLDGYFVFIRPGSQQFYISAIDDASDLDALDFASAERSPDNLVSLLGDHGELWLFGEKSVEIWNNTGNSEFTFERNNGAILEVGIAAAHTAQKLDSTVIWVGNDAAGAGTVWMAQGYKPARISTQAVEEAIQRSTDLASAYAYTYQQDGHNFYCLNVPGLDTTWCFDVFTGLWHERAELVDGAYAQHRANSHAYAFGKHLMGSESGKVYFLDKTKGSNDGDVKVRDRISPHDAVPSLDWLYFSGFEVDAEVGVGLNDAEAAIQLRYSNDGGATWSDWKEGSLGAKGKRHTRVNWRRLGRSKDRVWQVRCTDDVTCSLVNAKVS
jgi:hypothetical protein